MNKREFLKHAILFFPAAGVLQALGSQTDAKELPAGAPTGYDPSKHWYGMGIDVDKCIGCGRCMQACKTENDVPAAPFYVRTWVERYVIQGHDRSVAVNTIGPGCRGTARRHCCGKGHGAQLLRPEAMQPVRKSPLRSGLPGGRHVQDQGRGGTRRRQALHRLPLLYPGLSVRGTLSPSGRRGQPRNANSATTV